MAIPHISPILAALLLLGSSGCESSGDTNVGNTSQSRGDGGSGTSSSSQAGDDATPPPACGDDADCESGNCEDGRCSGGGGLVIGADCSADGDCASANCSEGTCAPGSGGSSTGNGSSSGTGDAPSGGDCMSGSDCQSGACVDGICQAMSNGTGQVVTSTAGPRFNGGGTSYRPLTTGCGPDTAGDCTGACEGEGGDPNVTVIRSPATLCFQGEGDVTLEDPTVVIEQVIEEKDGVRYAHLRVTFDPSFTDNTYGEGTCCGWPEQRGHWFRDLTGSDHAELRLTSGDGATVMQFKIDLIEEDPSAACGASTRGVLGGDGDLIQGSEEHVLAVATSTDRNLNGCGYCDLEACNGDCTVDSPPTDESYTPHPDAPGWDYRQVYEVWIALDAFGDAGFGQAFMTYVHSSPAKQGNPETIDVEPEPCPPDWDTPYCPPDLAEEGGNCAPPDEDDPCPTNELEFSSEECPSACVPIPFSGFENRAACPGGYVLDLASEGRYCLPEDGSCP